MLRRSLRILRTSLTILSLLLFTGTLALWARDHQTARKVDLGGLAWWSHGGWIGVNNNPTVTASVLARIERRLALKREAENVARLGAHPTSLPHLVTFREKALPCVAIAAVTAIAPTLKLRAILRARKQSRGFEVIPKSATIDSTAE